MTRPGDDINDVRLLQDDASGTTAEGSPTPIGGEEPTEEDPPDDGEKEPAGGGEVAPQWRVVALSSARGEPVKVVRRRTRNTLVTHSAADDDGVMDV